MDPKCYNTYPCKRGSETLEIDRWRRGDVMGEQRECSWESRKPTATGRYEEEDLW